jgi:molybdopterin-guanine dinucleotide biosynthesis protein B
MSDHQFPVLQIVGYSNSGKTTLIEQLIKYGVTKHSMKIASLKHDSHGFQIDQEGKDTWRHRQAGAELSLIQSPLGLGINMKQISEQPLEKLITLIRLLGSYDAVLIEGFKRECFTKIVLIRSEEDFHLIESLSQIKLLLFWNRADQVKYQYSSKSGNLPHVESYIINENQKIIDWVCLYWTDYTGG